MRRRIAGALVFICLLLTPAHAHRVIEGVGGFTGGVLHPLLVPTHALALIAVGLMAGAGDVKRRVVVLGSFVAACATAFAFIAMAFSSAQAERVVVALAALGGLVLAAGLSRSLFLSAVLTALIAGAIMFDSVPAIPSVVETTLALAGTTLAAALLASVVAALWALLRPDWRRIGTRILGSWIAASAVMVLALRLAA